MIRIVLNLIKKFIKIKKSNNKKITLLRVFRFVPALIIIFLGSFGLYFAINSWSVWVLLKEAPFIINPGINVPYTLSLSAIMFLAKTAGNLEGAWESAQDIILC